MTHETWPVVVVGAGAAGLVAAIVAGRAGARVLLLDTRRRPGAKIRVSGGGRCNVLPSQAGPADFFTSGSHKAMRNVLMSWPLAEVHAFFERDLGIPLKLEPTGKVFPRSDDARDVVEALLRAAVHAGVTFAFERRVTELRAMDSTWALTLSTGDVLHAGRVLLACGGLSMPRTGSDGGGWRMLRGRGHTVAPTYPALVPLLSADADLRALSGIAVPVRLQVGGPNGAAVSTRGDLLVTHRGLSGPAILDASRFVTAPAAGVCQLRAHWGHEPDWAAALMRPGPGTTVATRVRAALPRRLADLLIARSGVAPDARLADLPRPARRALVDQLQHGALPISGSEGYATAEVTAGGVPLSELYIRTLESRLCPGLFVAGEMLDVTGRLGGFNFLWAWASGRRAGLAMAAAA